MSNEFETYETNTLVFMVKIWVEEKADGKTKAKWRGYITHIPDHEKYYFSDLFEIVLFILPYLKKMGVRVSWFWRIMSWYKSKRQDHSDPQYASKEKI